MRLKHLMLLIVVYGCYKVYQNIQVSFSTAKAAIHSISQDERRVSSSPKFKETIIHKTKKRIADTPQKDEVEKSIMEVLVENIRKDKLCEYLKIVNEKGISKKQQMKALQQSFKDVLFEDLSVFLEEDDSHYSNNRDFIAKNFLLSRRLGAFSRVDPQVVIDYPKKGLEESDRKILKRINNLMKDDPENMFFVFLKIQVYKKYKNIPEEVLETLYKEVMNSSFYHNSSFGQLAGLYDASKKNATQFYLAKELFEKEVFSHNYFMTHSVWFFPTADVRAHVAEVLGRNIENYKMSAKAFGYDPGVYKGYRMVLQFEEYFATPTQEDFEKTREQPTYEIKELSLDLSQGCRESEVADLRTKLQSL